MEQSNNNSYLNQIKFHRSQLLPTNFTDEHNVLANGKDTKPSPTVVSREVSSISLDHQIPKRLPATPFLRSLNQPRNRDTGNLCQPTKLTAVCLDIEKVYHIVWRYRSLKFLQMNGIKNTFNFIKKFRHTRTVANHLHLES